MRSSKSRSRGKNRGNNNNNRSGVNIVNRVFDSSGPESKVRGTPQQIIDKYQQLHRDAQLSNDRVAAENFQQHAEHYTRMLGAAMREQEARQKEHDARREAQEAQARERQQNRDASNNDDNNASNGQNRPADQGEGGGRRRGRDRDPIAHDAGMGDQPNVLDMPVAQDGDTGLVETVESGATPKRPAPSPAAPEMTPEAKPVDAAEPAAVKAPRKPRAPRKPKAPKEVSSSADEKPAAE